MKKNLLLALFAMASLTVFCQKKENTLPKTVSLEKLGKMIFPTYMNLMEMKYGSLYQRQFFFHPPLSPPAPVKILVFIPTLTDDSEYASMLLTSFRYYFQNGFSFDNETMVEDLQKPVWERKEIKSNPEYENLVEVLLIPYFDNIDDSITITNYPKLAEKFRTVVDSTDEKYKTFGVPIPLSKSGNATILAIDNKNRIFWRDTAYRAQGEHLKPLENAIHEVLYPETYSLTKKSHLSSRKKLKIGDDAPDFILKEEQKLSDLKGKVVVLSFYPAAFSGILPKTDMETATAIVPRTTPEHIEKIEEMSRSCIGQIYRLDQNITAIRNDTIGKEKTNIINVVVSSSTPKLLYYWEKVLKTTATIYANDKSYNISHIYDSYNKQGYNNRALYVIDKKGKIAYIEKNYEEKTNEKIKEVIKKLE